MTKQYDYIIAGAGPAGAVAATYLAKAGKNVLVIEKELFPRDHVGEALLPFCSSVFKEIGIWEELTKSFTRKTGLTFRKADETYMSKWCYKTVIKDDSRLSFHVDRSKFDLMLINHAKKNGAKVIFQQKIVECDLANDSYALVKTRSEQGDILEYSARFFIDATGQSTFLANKFDSKIQPEKNRFSFWGHWKVKGLIGELKEASSQIIHLGDSLSTWLWIFPLEKNKVTIGIVASSDTLGDNREGDWKKDVYLKTITQSKLCNEVIDGGEMVTDIYSTPNYSYKTTNQYGKNYAMIGDARGFIDPIFSSGVFVAIKSSSMLAKALISGEPLKNCYNTIAGGYSFVEKVIATIYQSKFFKLSAIKPGLEKVQTMSETYAAIHYLVAGDFFNNNRFSHLIDFLQEDENFDKYKALVIDKYEDRGNLCTEEGDDIFPTSN